MPFGTQPSKSDVWARLRWDVVHLFDRINVNPYVAAGEGDALPKHRTGFEDITHAIKNVVVEYRRAR